MANVVRCLLGAMYMAGAASAAFPAGKAEQRETRPLRTVRDSVGFGFRWDDANSLGGRVAVSGACQAAMATACPACPSAVAVADLVAAAVTPSATCAAVCENDVGAECEQCIAQQVEQCDRCQEQNAASLVAAGCTHITCRRTMREACPSCLEAASVVVDGGCRQCAPGSATEQCAQCRAVAEQLISASKDCAQCQAANIDSLVAGDCVQLACRQVTGRLCPTCDHGRTETECLFCSPENTTALCMSCSAAREECETCRRANADDLVAGGCSELACPKELSVLCPTCPSLLQSNQQCLACNADSPTDDCKACQAQRASCAACMQSKGSALPGNCLLHFQPQTVASGRAVDDQGVLSAFSLSDEDAGATMSIASVVNPPRLDGAGLYSEECQAAVDAVCPLCPTPPPPFDAAGQQMAPVIDSCTVYCEDSQAPACAECRALLRDQCNVCQDEHADVLAGAGCVHVACRQSLQQLCPVCPTGAAALDADCRDCRPGNTSSECLECERRAQQCDDCLELNGPSLPENCDVALLVKDTTSPAVQMSGGDVLLGDGTASVQFEEGPGADVPPVAEVPLPAQPEEGGHGAANYGDSEGSVDVHDTDTLLSDDWADVDV